MPIYFGPGHLPGLGAESAPYPPPPPPPRQPRQPRSRFFSKGVPLFRTRATFTWVPPRPPHQPSLSDRYHAWAAYLTGAAHHELPLPDEATSLVALCAIACECYDHVADVLKDLEDWDCTAQPIRRLRRRLNQCLADNECYRHWVLEIRRCSDERLRDEGCWWFCRLMNDLFDLEVDIRELGYIVYNG